MEQYPGPHGPVWSHIHRHESSYCEVVVLKILSSKPGLSHKGSSCHMQKGGHPSNTGQALMDQKVAKVSRRSQTPMGTRLCNVL